MSPARPSPIKENLDKLVDELVSKGSYWPEARAQFEKLFILRVLRESRGNMGRASHKMGVHRNTLSKKIQKYKIDKRKFQ